MPEVESQYASTHNRTLTIGVLLADVPPAVKGVNTYTKTIKGVDGNDIDLFVTKPCGQTGPLPGLVHTHGGGMAIGSANEGMAPTWHHNLAAKGMVVVAVQFRFVQVYVNVVVGFGVSVGVGDGVGVGVGAVVLCIFCVVVPRPGRVPHVD